MIRTAVFILLSALDLLRGQEAVTTKPFVLGTPRQDIWEAFGRPDKWFVFDTKQYIRTQEFSAAVQVYQVIDDVYMRKTPANLYEVQLGYLSDARTSRLRPVQRLVRLEALVDRPAPAKTLLPDFPEASVICRAGCDLYGVTFSSDVYVLAYPSNPTMEEKKSGLEMALGFNREGVDELRKALALVDEGSPNANKPSETKDDWCVALKFVLEGQDGLDEKPRNYLGDVVRVETRPASLRYEFDPTLNGTSKPLKMGRWVP
jgi:hypothetical protein